MSIQSELNRLSAAKSDLKAAIEDKGVAVPEGTKLDGFGALVSQIQAGGGGGEFQTPPTDILSLDSGIGKTIIIDSERIAQFWGVNGPAAFPQLINSSDRTIFRKKVAFDIGCFSYISASTIDFYDTPTFPDDGVLAEHVNLIFRGDSIPVVTRLTLTFECYVYVPMALLEQYKAATNWSEYINMFRAIEDYPEIVGDKIL